MLAVVSLCAVLDVVQNHHAGDEVHSFPSGQEVQVGSAVPAAVTVTGTRRVKETPSGESVPFIRKGFNIARNNSLHSLDSKQSGTLSRNYEIRVSANGGAIAAILPL